MGKPTSHSRPTTTPLFFFFFSCWEPGLAVLLRRARGQPAVTRRGAPPSTATQPQPLPLISTHSPSRDHCSHGASQTPFPPPPREENPAGSAPRPGACPAPSS
eukprot:scaffold17712_cov111-Isochrysis_galbana.AAC.3